MKAVPHCDFVDTFLYQLNQRNKQPNYKRPESWVTLEVKNRIKDLSCLVEVAVKFRRTKDTGELDEAF